MRRIIALFAILALLCMVVCSASADPIKNYTLVDSDSITFMIREEKEDPIWGYSLVVFMENKTDKTLMFSIDDVVANGYCVEPFFAKEVAPGKKANDSITFGYSLDECGITSVDEVTFELRVYDSNDWFGPNIEDNTYTVSTSGKNMVIPKRRVADSEVISVDNEEISFIILESQNDSIWGYTLECYLENKTDKILMFTWDEVSVNGYMIDPFWATEVQPNARKYSEISFSKSSFEENYIDSVEEIEYTLRAYDSDDWFADDIVNSVFIYNP